MFSFDRTSLLAGKGFAARLEFVKWVHYSNSGVNPLLYTYRSEERRKMLTKNAVALKGQAKAEPKIHPLDSCEK